MLIKEQEKSKVNSSELLAYEGLLKQEEAIEDRLIKDFDKNIKTILGEPLYSYLKEKKLIKPAFLLRFHFSDIPYDEAFSYEDGSLISVRDYYKEKVGNFFIEHTEYLYKNLENKPLSEKLLDENIAYAFAVASLGLTTFHRKKGMYLREVQKLAGFGMAYGEIAELATGEGKTIAAVPPAFFHALRGKGVHIVTANSYLSKRDYIELSPVFEYLGLTCGYVESDEEEKDDAKLKESKKHAYRCDVTYSPKDEIAFDYLRDSTAKKIEDVVTREENPGFAIIDEVDDALLDCANSPYIIAGLPAVYEPNMTVTELADAMSVPVDIVLNELSLRGIKVASNQVLLKDEVNAIAELFSKNIYDDVHISLNVAQMFYTQLRMKKIPIREEDKKVFAKLKDLVSIENGIMRVNDIRLYNLLVGEEQNYASYSYFGKYALDAEDVGVLRTYAKLIVCPTSRVFYITQEAYEDYLNLQFLADDNTIKATVNCKDRIIKYLDKTYYTISKDGNIRLTPDGLKKMVRSGKLVKLFPEICNPYEKLINNKNELGSYYYHTLQQMIVANELLTLGEDYTIVGDEIILLRNAREQVGSKYSDGLEQAVEVKEAFNGRVKQTHENPSLASITQREFYSRYEMFSGMTGTSAKKIFEERYNKKTLEIPRDAYYRYYSKRLNREGRASDIEPRGVERRRVTFARNNEGKYSLILQSIKESRRTNPQGPVLIVVSDPNELFELEDYLLKHGIEPNVIENSRLGKEYKREMESVKVAKAGRAGMVTLATMMAGRGTDIQLGGDRDTIIEYATNKTMREKELDESARDEIRILCEESLLKQGLIPTKAQELEERRKLSSIGLKVIACGFFDSQRLDRQLEGRTGRNGISGITERYSSPEDLVHLGLERIHGEPLLALFARATKYTDGSVALDSKDYNRLIEYIRILQEAKDTEISNSIRFTQEMSVIASRKMEQVRKSRRKMLELTKDDATLLSNEKTIIQEVNKMIILTIDNLLVSYMRNNDFEGDSSILLDADGKDAADIDYLGLKLACKEVLGIDINIESFRSSDASILEFREALIGYAIGLHEELLKRNKLFGLKRDVQALLHKDDDNISRIHEELEENSKQKVLNYITGNESADNLAILSMGRKIRDLDCSSSKAGTRLLLGRILTKKEKEELERRRKALFDYRINKHGVDLSLSLEDDSEAINSFERLIKKPISANKEEKIVTDSKIVKNIKRKKVVRLTPDLYQNLRIRPMGFIMSVDGEFTLVKTGPNINDLLDGKKTI